MRVDHEAERADGDHWQQQHERVEMTSMNDTLKYVYFKAVCNYICTPTPMYIIHTKNRFFAIIFVRSAYLSVLSI